MYLTAVRRWSVLSLARIVMLTAILAILAMSMQLASSGVQASGGPSIAADQVTYDPGTTVTLSGSGFDAGSTLSVVLTRPDGSVVT